VNEVLALQAPQRRRPMSGQARGHLEKQVQSAGPDEDIAGRGSPVARGWPGAASGVGNRNVCQGTTVPAER
jgi:hypothetical protein